MPDSDADINLEKCFDNVLRAVIMLDPHFHTELERGVARLESKLNLCGWSNENNIQSWHVRGRDRQYGTSVGTDVQAYTVIGAVNAASAIFQGSAEIVSVETTQNSSPIMSVSALPAPLTGPAQAGLCISAAERRRTTP